MHVLQGFCWLLQVFTRVFRFLQGFSGFCEVLNSSARFCSFSRGFVGFLKVLQVLNILWEADEAKQLNCLMIV